MYVVIHEVDIMKSYSVKEIADILNTNPETVRRWIRSGKLASTMTSNKSGNMVSADSLNKFIKETPKYATQLAGSMMSSPIALSLVVGGIIGGLVNSIISSDKKKIKKEDVHKSLKRQIVDCERRIADNKAKLEKLQSKIETDESSLQQFRFALENLDLDLIAQEINNESDK